MAWVTDSPNFLTKRELPLRFRFHVAMAGALGLGGDLLRWTEAELAEAADLIATYKEIRPVIQRGQLYRLASVLDGSSGAFGSVGGVGGVRGQPVRRGRRRGGTRLVGPAAMRRPPAPDPPSRAWTPPPATGTPPPASSTGAPHCSPTASRSPRRQQAPSAAPWYTSSAVSRGEPPPVGDAVLARWNSGPDRAEPVEHRARTILDRGSPRMTPTGRSLTKS